MGVGVGVGRGRGRCRGRGRGRGGARVWGSAERKSNPNSNQAYRFLYFASGYRRRASVQTGLMMRGLSERTLVQHVSSVTKHVFPTLYPRMVDTSAGGMGRDSYRAFGNDLLKAVRNLFSEAGQEALGLDVQHRLLAAEAQAATARAVASHASIGRAVQSC